MIYTIMYGFTIGAILYFISVGLSLTFGTMRVINFAHTLIYTLGVYFLAGTDPIKGMPRLLASPEPVTAVGGDVAVRADALSSRIPPAAACLWTSRSGIHGGLADGVVLNLTKYEVVNKETGMVKRTGPDTTVTLRGVAYREERGVPPTLIDGYAFTPVPADFWEAWLKANKGSSLLADGYLIESKTSEEGKAKARERIAEPGQFSRMIEKDPRASSPKIEKFKPEEMAA